MTTDLQSLHLYDPVRVIWLDSFVPDEGSWRSVDEARRDMEAGWPIHETVGLWFGIASACVCVIQSRSAGGPTRDLVDSPIGIPLAAVLLVQRLGADDG
jgi:hypothetical protein